MTRDRLLTVLGALASTGAITLHNARGGFACNSSSSHSIVVLPAGLTLDGDPHDGDEYGWNDFALVEAGDKIRYLAAMVRNNRAAQDALATLREAYDVEVSKDAYVDGQSQLNLPSTYHGETLDPEFLTDLATLLADPQVAILGGNDNGGHTEHERDDMVRFALDDLGLWRARKDITDAGTWWVLFDDRDGTKLRISLNVDTLRDGAAEDPADARWRDDNDPRILTPAPFTPVKAASPELVDVKVTDACPFQNDCGFCYQASTKDGAAGDPVRVATLLAALADQKVFEVAFGGGEPTLWPHFGATLAYARTLGIVPNFTTKNYSWLTGPDKDAWLGLVGAVAFSVNSRTAMDRLTKKVDAAGLTRVQNDKLCVQLIPDLVPAEEFTYILTQAARRGWRVTLLGYKDVGRGATFTPPFRRDPGWWIDAAQKVHDADGVRLGTVAIDTALAVSSRKALQAAGVPDWMYHLREGAFSMYVDAVTGQMGPSSYDDPATFTPVDLDGGVAQVSAAVAAAFAGYRPEENLPC